MRGSRDGVPEMNVYRAKAFECLSLAECMNNPEERAPAVSLLTARRGVCLGLSPSTASQRSQFALERVGAGAILLRSDWVVPYALGTKVKISTTSPPVRQPARCCPRTRHVR